MIRFFATVYYMTAGGNPGGCHLRIVARDFEQATQLARRRASIRGRSRFQITITREA